METTRDRVDAECEKARRNATAATGELSKKTSFRRDGETGVNGACGREMSTADAS